MRRDHLCGALEHEPCKTLFEVTLHDDPTEKHLIDNHNRVFNSVSCFLSGSCFLMLNRKKAHYTKYFGKLCIFCGICPDDFASREALH